jgi:MFS transporter, ACS family, hexuronate transporter
MPKLKSEATASAPKATTTKGRYRWLIVLLLLLATTINYIDRNVIAFTMIDDGFRKEMLGIPAGQALTEADVDRFRMQMGFVDSAFKWAYGLGFIFIGWLIDRIGTRRGFSLSIFLWSLAGMSVAFTKSIFGLGLARFALGLGEAGNYPASIKSVAEWFPRKERALATGIFNSGANFGIVITALVVPWLTLTYGWRSAFLVTGLLGFVLLFFWLLIYRQPEEHKKVSEEELAYIRSDQEEESSVKISWVALLGYRQTWAFVAGKFFTDPIWWFYLTWLPDFFNSNAALEQKLDLKNVGIPFLIIYIISDLGNIFFGWLSSYFIKKGWPDNSARKVTMLICALLVTPVMFASMTNNIHVAIALIALATAAHQGYSVTNFTIISDMFPKNAVASVVGIGGVCGAIMGGLFAALAGFIIVYAGYIPLFIYVSTGYLMALTATHFLAPKLERVKI